MTQKIANRLNELINYLQPLLSFANCHMVDFFTNNIYQTQVSSDIQREIDSLGCLQTLNLILNSKLESKQCPKLFQFISECKKHTLPNFTDVCLSLSEFQIKLIDLGCENLSGLHLEIFMNSKKSHEVEILSEISAAVSEIAKVQHVVDIGDGRGYLSSALALHSGLKVLGVDSSDINTKSAAKRIGKLNKILKSDNRTNIVSELYKQTTKYVTENCDLNNLVKDYFPNEDIDKLSLVGLHTCGNLASSCLKIFVNNPDVQTVCNVGCCYHLITEDNIHFPMSKYLQEKQFCLGRNVRMLSCQSLERILDKKELPSEILFYRSLLQILLKKYCPELIDKHVGRFGPKSTTFLSYVQKAIKKFDPNITIPEDEVNKLYNEYLPFQKYLQIFYILRAHVALVIESVILLDRLLFLYEHNIKNAFLIQLFDPVISPRCYGLVAFKNESV